MDQYVLIVIFIFISLAELVTDVRKNAKIAHLKLIAQVVLMTTIFYKTIIVFCVLYIKTVVKLAY
jgi:hypothetical protein